MFSKLSDKIWDGWNVPKETVLPLAYLRFAENRELTIENYFSILELSDKLIRIKTKYSIIKIVGVDLTIDYINKYDLLIKGIFYEVKFEH